MNEDQWYQVRYNADGEVIKVEAEKDHPTWLDYDAVRCTASGASPMSRVPIATPTLWNRVQCCGWFCNREWRC